MTKIEEILHAKRGATEARIRQLERDGRAGVRYTATRRNIPFLIFGLLCDIGWLIHLIAGIVYFRSFGLRQLTDYLALLALAAVMLGVGYTVYMNKIHEKEMPTRTQKNMSFGLTVFGGLAGAIIGIAQMLLLAPAPKAILWMVIGGALNFATGLPLFLSFKKGIQYGIQ